MAISDVLSDQNLRRKCSSMMISNSPGSAVMLRFSLIICSIGATMSASSFAFSVRLGWISPTLHQLGLAVAPFVLPACGMTTHAVLEVRDILLAVVVLNVRRIMIVAAVAGIGGHRIRVASLARAGAALAVVDGEGMGAVVAGR